jgi:hypothetical protein
MLELSQDFVASKNMRYIAEISTGQQRSGIDDIKGFISLQFLPNSCE